MSYDTFVRWTCNHCGGQTETSLRSKPQKGISYGNGEYQSPSGQRQLPDIWLCGECVPFFARYCKVNGEVFYGT